MEQLSLFTRYFEPLVVASAVIAVEYFALLLAILLDLRAGTRKARERGERRTSRGLRRTVAKASSYFITLLSLTLMDVPLCITLLYLRLDMGLLLPVLPIFTTIGSLCMIFIEGKSIRESAESKTAIDPTLTKLLDHLHDPNTLRQLLSHLSRHEKIS